MRLSNLVLIISSIVAIGSALQPTNPAQAKPSKINDQFRESIYKGCIKGEGNTKTLCSCYSTRISRRYNATQAIAIYRLSKSSDEARKMFFLAHAPDYAFCKQRP